MAHDPLKVSQSVLDTASLGTNLINDLSVWLIVGAALLLMLVMVLLVRGAWSGPVPVNSRVWIVAGGLVMPVVVLAALLVQGVRVGSALAHEPGVQGMEVEVIARRWWWEFRYRDPHGVEQVVLANELHLPLDCTAVLTLASNDVIHSFWVPALAGKVDVIPGQTHRLIVHASRTGRFRGQCAEYCGTQHANMALEVVVESPLEFRDWLHHQATPAADAADPTTQRGQQVFMASGCGSCHSVRGTSATGRLGPDLTHVAGRRMLAAATLHNDASSLVSWIRHAQHLKPGSLMPSLSHPMDDEDMRALAAYLGSLH